MLRPAQTLVIWIVTGVSLMGLGTYFLSATKLSAKVLGLLVFLVYPLPYYIIQSSRRYRFPLEPILLLFACYFVARLLDRALSWYRRNSIETFEQGGLSGVSILHEGKGSGTSS